MLQVNAAIIYNIHELNNRMTGNGDSNRSTSSSFLRNSSEYDDSSKRKRSQTAAATAPQSVANSKNTQISLRSSSSFLELENKISKEVPQNRPNEIYEFMKLFGYKPERSIVQVHLTGFFRKKKYTPREIEQHKTATKRYGGTTFVVIGRTHDPSIMEMVVKPKKKNPYDNSPGYIGYLWKNKDPQKRAPHEIIPLDFTPIHLPYPTDWKNMFATKGFMLAMHVPSFLAKDKSKLTRSLYRIAKSRVDVKQEWKFLNELKNVIITESRQLEGFTDTQTTTKKEKEQKQEPTSRVPTKSKNKTIDDNEQEDPLRVLKLRLAKGDIDKKEYQELYNAISS
jgi:hypothetical protein